MLLAEAVQLLIVCISVFTFSIFIALLYICVLTGDALP
jgi:hypothetical protein